MVDTGLDRLEADSKKHSEEDKPALVRYNISNLSSTTPNFHLNLKMVHFREDCNRKLLIGLMGDFIWIIIE